MVRKVMEPNSIADLLMIKPFNPFEPIRTDPQTHRKITNTQLPAVDKTQYDM